MVIVPKSMIVNGAGLLLITLILKPLPPVPPGIIILVVSNEKLSAPWFVIFPISIGEV